MNTQAILNNSEPSLTQQHSKLDDKAPSFMQIFRFADKTNAFMMIIGAIGSLCVGACTPLTIYIIVGYDQSYRLADDSQKYSDSFKNLRNCVYVGIAAFVFGWLMATLWVITGERQSSKCKKAYYESLLNQDAEFFDCNQHSFVNSKFIIDTEYFQSALGQKIGVTLQIFGNFIAAMAISFWQGWFMTLVMFASIIIVLLSAYFNMTSIKEKQIKFVQLYSKAGGRAQEAITAIKTVKHFNAEAYELNVYSRFLEGSQNEKVRSIVKISLSFGMINSLVFLIYSFGFWFGGKCLIGDRICLTNLTGAPYTSQNVHVIFFCQLMCLLEFSMLAPAIKQITLGKEAANRILKVIDRVPKIDKRPGGIKPQKIGKVQLRNVSFAYPKDKSRNILNGISIIFDLRSSAIVGESGCGKSTIAQLLMRLYDPDEGQILIDGYNIRDFDLAWLRSLIGYVGQQPVLFAATIRDNLLYANPNASQDQMKEALHQAEVYDLVFNHLEKGLDTYVGVGGSQISGGQKQRIAIARALVKQPQLLILDEATSALDRSNQRAIQETLNHISETLSTITIAHRLSTIRSSHTIFVIEDGKVKEQGSFEQLQYFSEINNQRLENIRFQQKQSIKRGGKRYEQGKESTFAISAQKTVNLERLDLEDAQAKPITVSLVERYNSSMFKRIFSYNTNKKLVFILSIVVSIGVGLIYPIFAIFISEVYIEVLDSQDNKTNSSSNSIDQSSLKLFITGITAFFLFSMQTLCGQIVCNQISTNLRTTTYGKILKMPITWFEKKENTCGAISSRLSVECEKVRELITTYVYIIVRCVTTIISGFIIMFIYEWMISLVIVGFIFVLIGSGVLKSHFKTKLAKQADLVNKQIGGMIQESLINIRTVSSFNMQEILINKYERTLKAPSESLIKIGVVSGIMNGIVLFIITSVIGILIHLGIVMMIHFKADKLNILTSIFAFNLMAATLAKNLTYLPDVESIKISAANIFSILDGQDEEQGQERGQSKRLTEGFKGDIQFRDVSFKHEDRQLKVLLVLNLRIREGEKVALVGASGCGKSTLIQLLLRFYEPTSGIILVGDTPLGDFDFAFLRSQFGVVAQQPTIFNGSFRDNIAYNIPATEQQIRDAVIRANALEFIEGSHEGEIEEKENQVLSGKLEFVDSIFQVGRNSAWPSQEYSYAIQRYCCQMRKLLLWMRTTSVKFKTLLIRLQSAGLH